MVIYTFNAFYASHASLSTDILYFYTEGTELVIFHGWSST